MANPLSNSVKTGTIGELLVQLRLLQFNVQAAPPLRDSGNDLIGVKGEVFRAIQVKTSTREFFQIQNLPEKYHILILVYLVGENNNVYLDKSLIFLLKKDEINKGYYSLDELAKKRMSKRRVEELFR